MTSPEVHCLNRAVLLAASTKAAAGDCAELFAKGTALPAHREMDAQLPPVDVLVGEEARAYVQVLLAGASPADSASAIGELVVARAAEGSTVVTISATASVTGELNIRITEKTTSNILAELALSPTP